MAALIASWIYGAHVLGGGYEVLAFFRGERPDIHEMTDSIKTTEAREAAFAAGEQWVAVREGAKKREMPFGAASLLLGAAMVLLAARSMAGREGSRRALIQVVVVHAAVMTGAYFWTKDVAAAEVAFSARLGEGVTAAMTSSFPDPATRQGAEALRPIIEHALAPLTLLMGMAFSALIVVALTRPRARAFFRNTAAGPLSEG